MKRLAPVSCLLASLLLASCSARVANVTNLPPGVTLTEAKDWDSAIAKLHKIALATSFLRQSLIDVNAAEPLDKTAYTAALESVGKIDLLQLSASQALRQEPQHWGVPTKVVIAQYAAEILGQIQQLNAAGVTGIKNPASLKKINGLIAEVEAAAKFIAQLAA